MHVNPFILSLLDSRAHRLLPASLTAIAYTGPVTRRHVRLPVLTVPDGEVLVAVAGRPERKQWWRAFRAPQRARLVRGGRSFDVTGRLLTGAERDDAIETYLAAHPGSRRGTGPDTPVVAFAPRPA